MGEDGCVDGSLALFVNFLIKKEQMSAASPCMPSN